MTTQAKNRILAYYVIFMMAVIFVVGKEDEPAPPTPTRILIPADVPVEVAVVEEDPASAFDQTEFECLRMNIYHEAGNQNRRGKEAIALVTLNRSQTKHFPSTICGVVTQAVVVNGVVKRNKCQFSWYCDGKSDAPNLRNPLERKAWEEATEVATAAMEGKLKDFLGRATHYHATYVNPGWASASRIRRLTQVGTHIFYRDVKLGLKA
jgi:N-acetylmuramoyl-L-alanine amidase